MATKKTAKKKGKKKGIPAAGVAAGVLAAGAAAGAAYYFYGAKHAKQHRAAAAKWAAGMKREVVREAKKLSKLDEKAMHAVVDRVSRAYMGAKAVDPAEVRKAASELKRNWEKMRAELKGPVRRAVKKAMKKSPKKAAKKRRS